MVLAAGPFGLGPMELVIILLVLVMLFGATRLTDLGSSLGKGIKEFRKNVKDDDDEDLNEAPGATTRTVPPSSTTAPSANEEDAHLVTAVKCPSCGSLNPATAKHCNQCGASIAAPVS
jgi:sec-independent protein translocase protein TatA